MNECINPSKIYIEKLNLHVCHSRKIMAICSCQLAVRRYLPAIKVLKVYMYYHKVLFGIKYMSKKMCYIKSRDLF